MVKSATNKKAAAAPAMEIGRETKSELYRLQLELRYCEKRAYDLFLQNLIKGTSHLSLGQEALNFAAVWKLPVVYVCENNLYMEYTPISAVTAVEHPAADRASAYGLPSIVVDGNDADAVCKIASEALAKARAGGGPSLIEAMTYRHSGHSRADPGKYRPEGELDKWLLRDPAVTYRERLLTLGINEPTLKDMEAEAMGKVAAATATATASALPSAGGLEKNVWADGGAAWRN